MATESARIALEELKELAGFWADECDALSVFLQVRTPSELSHREEVISAKDQIQHALGSLKGRSPADRADVQRVLETVGAMKGNGGRAKIIFACNRKKLWREYNLAGEFSTRAEAGSAFVLSPVLAQEQKHKRYCIALADRNRARLLLLEAGNISEHSQVLDEEKEKIRTTGTNKAQLYERRKEEQVRKHFQFLAEHLLHFHEHKDYDWLLVGCREEMWPEIEAELHPELKRVLVGRITVDPGLAPAEEIRERAQSIVDRRDREEEERLVESAVGGAASHTLGVVGLRNVLDSLEKGEVRTLLWSAGDLWSKHSASVCQDCGRLEVADPVKCALCGGHMRRFAHAEEAVLRHALGRRIEVRRMRWTKLPPPDEIAAWLRYRSEGNTPQTLAS